METTGLELEVRCEVGTNPKAFGFETDSPRPVWNPEQDAGEVGNAGDAQETAAQETESANPVAAEHAEPEKLRDLIVMGVNQDEAPEKVIWAGADPTKVLADLPCVGLSGDRYCAPMRVSEKWMPYQMSCMVIDPSGRGQDETA